VDWTCL